MSYTKHYGDYNARVHLFPFRTEKLRPVAQMVLPFWWESMSLPPSNPSLYGWDFFMTITNLSEFSISNSFKL